VESSLGPQDAARYYSNGGVGANSVFSPALTSVTKLTASEMALAFHATLLNAPEDSTPTWTVSTYTVKKVFVQQRLFTRRK
jgi:hypothetical protein